MQLVAKELELAWGREPQLLTGVAKSNGGSSGDEKSELSKVDSDTHSSK